MKRIALFCLTLGVAGCGARGAEPEQDELQALLRDEPLDSIGAGTTSAALRPGVRDAGSGGGGSADGGGVRADSGSRPDAGGGGGSLDAGTAPVGDGGSARDTGGGFDAGRDGSVVVGPDAGGGSSDGSVVIGPDASSGDFDGSGGGFGDGGSGGFGDGGGDFGDGGSFPGGDAGTSSGGGSLQALGRWPFDDCNGERTNLRDTSGNDNTAFRAVSVACGPGISGQAVVLAIADQDIVTVPDQPSFVFPAGVTAAGWFNPAAANQTSTLVRKRDDDTSAFALMLHQGRYKFVVNLGRGRAAAVTSPARAVLRQWTHVAATYDGVTLRLYVDGTEVASTRVRGSIPTTSGPVVMGNDGTQRLFRGAIDNAFLDARALSPAEILQLLCIRGQPTLSATPSISTPTLPGVPADYQVVVTNNDSPSCPPTDFVFQAFALSSGIDVQPNFHFVSVPADDFSSFTVSVTADDSPEPGTHTIPMQLFTNDGSAFATTSVDFELAASGCRVSPPRSLMITHLSVVDDPVRTTGAGVWTFQHLMEAMAPTPADAPAMVEAMLGTFTVPTTINGFTVAPRPGMEAFILANWPRVNGQLDLSQAPLTLQAIVNRFDLRDAGASDAGEGRFVFGFDFPGSFFPLQATLIVEYKLPSSSPQDVAEWAAAWHALGSLPFPSEAYNAALEAVTEGFAGRGVRPGAVNGSALNTVRTNEIDLGDNGRWELREFRLSPVTGRLVPSTLDRTPDFGFSGGALLGAFINANEAAILSETHAVPNELEGAPFAAGAVFNDFIPWTAEDVSSEARFRFGMNTCNGCHSPETNTGFLHVSPRFPGGEASLSAFLTGTTVFDPFTGEPRPLNELARRAREMRAIVCP